MEAIRTVLGPGFFLKQPVLHPRILLFVGVVTLLFGAAHYYLWARFVRDSGLSGAWREAGSVLAFLLWLSFPLLIALRLAKPNWSRFAEPLVYHWVGMLWFSLLALAAADLLRLTFWVFTRQGLDPIQLSRLISVAAAAVLVLALVARSGAMNVQLVKVEIKLGPWPEALEGLRIVQLSDVHLGSTLGKAYMEELVRRTNELKPDIVAITGDLIDGELESLRPALEPLKNLNPRLGSYYVLGNHEYFHGLAPWLQALPEFGLKFLDNQRLRIQDKGAAFDLAGVDDPTGKGWGRGPDYAAALDGREAGVPCILLAHQPKALPEAARRGVELVLAGHTHGGQIWPFKHLVRLDQPYVAGLYELDGTQLYVSQGSGFWGPPMRLGTTSEITLLEIKRQG